jgi:hypothetical protein
MMFLRDSSIPVYTPHLDGPAPLPVGIALAAIQRVGWVETRSREALSAPWGEARLTPTQWRQLEARLSAEERVALDGLRRQWVMAAEQLEDALSSDNSYSYDALLTPVNEAEEDFHAFVRALRSIHRI